MSRVARTATAEERAARARRLARWEDRTEWPLAVAAVVFLAAYAWPILNPHHTPRQWVACEILTWLTWAGFVADYAVRVRWAEDRWAYVRAHAIDLVIIALPALRPLRLLRLITLLTVLNRAAGDRLRGKVVAYVVSAAVVLIAVAALSVLDAERGHEGATILTYPEALWWALTTVTTVGYGDYSPVTGHGRVIAAVLMMCGVALIGVVTGSMASWIVDRVREDQEDSETATRADLVRLHDEVRALRAELASLRPTDGSHVDRPEHPGRR